MEEKKSLYQISAELHLLSRQIEENLGTITEVDELLLDQLSVELVAKTDGVVDYIKSREDRIKAINTRKKELAELETYEKVKLDNFKKYVIKAMSINEHKKLEGNFSRITLRKPLKKLYISDENKIPLEFIQTETVTKILNTDLKNALKNGELIEGAELVNGEAGLLVK